ncbi:unnamed protein product (macronuclear) [Paramecium tetraurelia]|uniref:RGS domain-containing protein n=1 Tax=Paramecium tetraurelia TaxID=5888 RepID=A0E709_PARTE|nr:uncharacterized protein GSPATT00023804001 [Paramecium tetraurelia]CAK91076.1 unnamed protein product [Paramecium tetraurelia]|eukprot:XP_001458473.1 hypothetical protein (macronuclear) [Paramecium tetraurelia strain d4-2]
MQQLCLQISEQTLIPSIVIIALLSLISVGLLFQTYKLRNWNPIQELSPLLTIFQGLSLYLFIVLTLLVIVYDGQNNFHTTKIIMIFQNFFRGLFVYITVFKSLRVTLAFHLNIKSSNLLKFLCTKLFRYQFRILIVALLMTSAFWSGIYYIVILYNEKKNYSDQDHISDLIQYENINIVEAINNTLEIVLCMLIIYWNQKIFIPQFDTLQKFVNKPLLIYAIWLYINTFISYFINEMDCKIQNGPIELPFPLIVMIFSQILRSMVEFYYIVYIPIQQSTLIRLPLIPSIILDNFQLFMRIPLCSSVFYEFLQQPMYSPNFNSKERRVNHSLSLEYSDSLQVLKVWMAYQMKLENGIEDEHFTLFLNLEKQQNDTLFDFNYQPQIQVRLEKHLMQLFEEYQNTFSYYNMKKLFHCLDNATKNFYEMNIIQNFLN